MDNDNLSKKPVSELTPENLNSLKGDQVFEEPHKTKPCKPQGNNRLPLLIAGVVLLLGVGVALFFIFRKPAEPETPTSQEEPADELEPTWKPSGETTDVTQEFYEHHQSIVDSSDTTHEEKFTSTLEIANLYTVSKRFSEAEALLNSIARESLTFEEQFRLYGVYQFLYEQSGDAATAEEYAKLADEAMNAYLQSPTNTSGE